MNSAIGPYKGGLRFHPSVNLGMLKFLAFEQVFKNALTTLPMGGGKGGSDFDPKGKSDNEVMRFCQSFMTELFRHIGPDHRRAPPATSAWAAARSASCSASTRSCANRFDGVLTGKGLNWGGSLDPARGHRLRRRLLRPGDARHPRRRLQGQDRARFRLGQRRPVHRREGQPARRQGHHPVRLRRHIVDPDGIDAREAGLRPGAQERQARPHRGVRLPSSKAQFLPDKRRRLGLKCDVAFPCATQNEINGTGRRRPGQERLHLRGRRRQHAHRRPRRRGVPQSKILYGPGKAANAGGVATSGLEMSQNAMRLTGPAKKSTPACTAS